MNKRFPFSILPSKSYAFEHVFDQTIAKFFNYRKENIFNIKNIYNFRNGEFDKIASHFLDRLAESFGIEYWDNGWNDIQKRNIIKIGVDLNRYAGSLYVIKKLFKDFLEKELNDKNVTSWYETGKTEKSRSFGMGVIEIKMPPREYNNQEDIKKLLDKYGAMHVKLAFKLQIRLNSEYHLLGILSKKTYKKLEFKTNSRRKMKTGFFIIGIISAKKYIRIGA